MKTGFNRNRLKYSVNEKFFDKWTSQMAYILGFTFADGNIYKTSLAWDIQKRDLNLLINIKKAMGSTYPITNRSNSVRLRMSNQNLNKSVAAKGLIENKAKRMDLPEIPKKFASHFVRGFLDGDGWIVSRNNRNEVDLGFVSGNKIFLENISHLIYKNTEVSGRVREKNKITPKGFKSKTFLMEFYSNNSIKVANWIYSDLGSEDIFLERKYAKYLSAVELYKYLNSGASEISRTIQRRLKKPMKDILNDLNKNKHLDGFQIADILGVHSSSVYRWLEKTGVKYVEHRKIVYG